MIGVKWTREQLDYLAKHPEMNEEGVAQALSLMGPFRSVKAVRTKRRDMKTPRSEQRKAQGGSDYRDRGWPIMVGDDETRDRQFVLMVIREGIRLGASR